MNFYAYLLRCSDGSYYAGHTDDLDLRVAQHQSGEIVRVTGIIAAVGEAGTQTRSS